MLKGLVGVGHIQIKNDGCKGVEDGGQVGGGGGGGLGWFESV